MKPGRLIKTAGIAAILLLGGMLNAQMSANYAFTESSTVWEPVFGDYATDAMTDEGITGAIDIGFSFPYCGSNFTQVKISSNGWVNLGGNLTNPYYNNSSGLAALNLLPILTPLWDDLSLQFGAVQYITYGEAPHRIFVVQWLAAKWNYAGNNEFNFMVRLHETGQIDFIYGPHTGSPNNASATIGINAAPGGNGNYYTILPGTPAQAFTTTQYNNISAPLANGTMYVFMPKTTQAANASAVNLRGPKNPMQSVASNYVVTVGNAGTAQILTDEVHVYLMRGTEILGAATVTDIMPGAFAEATISWTPAATGLTYLTAKTDLSNDADSLNDVCAAYPVTVQPYVGNDDETDTSVALNLSAHPNPFRERVVLQFKLDETEQVSLKIYDLKGRLVRDLLKETGIVPVKSTVVDWNGLDEKGRAVPKGIYLAKLTAGNKTSCQKLVKLY